MMMSMNQLSFLPTMQHTDVDEEGGNALTKDQLSQVLASCTDLKRREAKEVVDTFFDIMLETLLSGEELKLSGFGHFQVRSKTPRPGRNPRTGETVPISARRVVTFHPSDKLREAVERGGLSRAATTNAVAE